MVAIRLSTFSGATPIRDLRLLPDDGAVQAVNVNTDGGALKGISGKSLIKALTAGTKYVYKLPYDAVTGDPLSPSNMTNAKWLEFADINTDVVRTPNVNDSFDRYYWASPSTGFKYATRAQLMATGPSAGIDVGIEVPVGALNVAPAGGDPDAPVITRAYMQTFVSVYGEEGQPGPAVDASGKADAVWAISNIRQPVNAPGTTEIDRIRIYRTITSSAGVTTFFLVITLPVGTLAYADTLTDVTVGANSMLQSTLWAPPPEGLEGVVAMPNGIFVGWKGNTLYFCENFRPHAWPAEYALTVQYPIVGLGVFGQTCVVCTTGNPATVTGTRSSTMALTQGTVALPCRSRRGIVSALEGVYFPSTDGLVLVSPSGASIVTEQIISKKQWEDDFLPGSLKAYYSRGMYGALKNTDGFVLTTAGVITVDPFTSPVAFGVDSWSNNVWLIDNNQLYQWEDVSQTRLTYRWRSKEFVLPRKGNLAVAQVYFDDSVPASETVVRLRVWADRVLIYDDYMPFSGHEYRLPSGFKADIWQFELEASVRIHNLNVASTAKELASV